MAKRSNKSEVSAILAASKNDEDIVLERKIYFGNRRLYYKQVL